MDNQQVASAYILTQSNNGRFYVGSHRGNMDNYWGSFSDKTFQPDKKYIIYIGTECVARLLESNMIRCWKKHTKIVNKAVPGIRVYDSVLTPETKAKISSSVKDYFAKESEESKLLRSQKMKHWMATNEHPKGFLGHQHTESAKDKVRIATSNNNPMHNKVHRDKHAEWTSSEECSKMRSKQCTGPGNPNAKTVIYEGKVYKTMREFYQETGISNYKARNLAKSNPETLKIIYTRDLNDYLERE